MDGKKLINDLKKGDEKAFEDLVNKYSDSLFGYALSLSGNHHTASDIVQEVFIITDLDEKSIKEVIENTNPYTSRKKKGS